MLSTPSAGWSVFTLDDFQTSASYMTDIPFDWLRACKNGLQYVIPASFYLDAEGSECLITSDWDCTYIISRSSGTNTLYKSNVNLGQFAEMLLTDLKKDFDLWAGWVTFRLSDEQYTRRKAMLKALIEETEQYLKTYMKDEIRNY